MKGINFNIVKNLAHACRNAKCASVCVSVCLFESTNRITFDPLHDINLSFLFN